MSLGENFVEIFFVFLLILGLISALVTQSTAIHYIIIFLFGIISVSFNAISKKRVGFLYIIIIIGFVLGFFIGTRSGSRFEIIFLFVLGVILGFFFKKYLEKYL